MYRDSNGKLHEVYNCGARKQDDMVDNKGYTLHCAEWQENEQDLYNRLSKYYKTVRIYWSGTRIPGIHNIFAMCK